MTTEQITLTGAKETLLFTLYFRALDFQSHAPIVNDQWAAEVLDRFAYDNRKLRRKSSDRYGALLRAKRLDDWTRNYLLAQPDAIVLHLGCGLDSRAFRLDIPDTVRWFDVDYPEVIELRRRVYPDQAGYRMIGSSVTDPDWLDEIPADHPVLVVAEGLLMYLAADDVVQLLQRLIGRFPRGEMAFDVVPKWVTRLSKLLRWAPGDPRELEREIPRLTLVEAVPVTGDFARIPSRGYRTTFRLMNTLAPMRNMMLLLHFRF